MASHALFFRFGVWLRKVRAEMEAEGDRAKKEEKPEKEKEKPAVVEKIRHEWYQTDKDVVLTIFRKGVSRQSLTETVEPSRYEAVLALGEGREWRHEWTLAHEIVPADCRTDILGSKIEVSNVLI